MGSGNSYRSPGGKTNQLYPSGGGRKRHAALPIEGRERERDQEEGGFPPCRAKEEERITFFEPFVRLGGRGVESLFSAPQKGIVASGLSPGSRRYQ